MAVWSVGVPAKGRSMSSIAESRSLKASIPKLRVFEPSWRSADEKDGEREEHHTWKTYAWACALIAAPVTPMTKAGKGLKLAA